MCIHVRLPKASDRLGSDRSPFKLAHRKLLRECCCWFSISIYTKSFVKLSSVLVSSTTQRWRHHQLPHCATLTAAVAARAAVLEVEWGCP